MKKILFYLLMLVSITVNAQSLKLKDNDKTIEIVPIDNNQYQIKTTGFDLLPQVRHEIKFGLDDGTTISLTYTPKPMDRKRDLEFQMYE